MPACKRLPITTPTIVQEVAGLILFKKHVQLSTQDTKALKQVLCRSYIMPMNSIFKESLDNHFRRGSSSINHSRKQSNSTKYFLVVPPIPCFCTLQKMTFHIAWESVKGLYCLESLAVSVKYRICTMWLGRKHQCLVHQVLLLCAAVGSFWFSELKD